MGVGDLHDRFAPALVRNLPPLTQISTRGNFNLGIDLFGNIWGWGDNSGAVFGSFTTDESVSKPVSLSLLVKNLDSKPIGIAAGTQAAIILTSKGSIYTFGSGLLGHSGELTAQTSVLPVKIGNQFFGKSKPVAVFAGDNTFGVLTETGELFNWGNGRSNCIGVYQEVSAKVKKNFREDME